MTVETLLTLFSGGAIALISFFAWLAKRTIAHQGQIKNLETKIDHLDERLETKMDMVIASNSALMKSHDDRISRLEKYFDAIMSMQIKKNSDQLKMEC